MLRLTFFLGPTGIFFTPVPGIGSLRSFYFATAIVNIVFLCRMAKRDLPHYGALMVIFLILFLSSSFCLISLSYDVPLYLNPVVRVLVICNLMFGFFNVSRMILNSCRKDILQVLLSDSFKGFCCVFFLGLALYVGYIAGKVPSDIYNRFTTLEQEAYGYSRFSPGTYPNEFGVICSFYALYAVLLSQRKKGGAIYLLLSAIFMGGVFLTSTRAAYITLAIGYTYIAFSSPGLIRRLVLCILPFVFAPVIVIVLGHFSFDVIDVITRGYDSAANQTGSSNVRMEDWNAAVDDLLDNFYFGVGFESPKAYSLHNLPLQIVYGLGLLGVLLLVLAFSVFAYVNSRSSWVVRLFYSDDWRFLRSVRVVLFIHVIIFGLTNHNQAHFFTWMLFALCCIRIKMYGPARSGTLNRPGFRGGYCV
ncbi:O-antigen ligase family protein [Pseudomonas sp. PDM18]|nr:O-antigen ligase family protein [Pseudomonas sp. PDM18]